MIALIVMFITGIDSPAAPRSVAESVLSAYSANREKLGARGTINYRFTNGSIDSVGSDDDQLIDAIRKGKWKKSASVDCVFAFDGNRLFVSQIYPIEEMIKHRVMISKSQWRSDILSFVNLTDGESTINVHIDPSATTNQINYSPTVSKGTNWFFHDFRNFPLDIANPVLPDYDLSMCLTKALDKGGALRLNSALEKDDGSIKIEVVDDSKKDDRYRYDFLCDMKRAGLPVLTVWDFSSDNTQSLSRSINLMDDIRKVGSIGWFPFKKTIVFYQKNHGKTDGAMIKEYEILSASFDEKPDPSLFKIEFPEPRKLVDGDRNLVLNARKVWDLKSISPASLGRSQKFVPTSPQTQIPEMPGPFKPGTPWWAILLAGLGIALILIGSKALYRRIRHG